MTEKIGAWVGVISSIVTVGLTVYNAKLNSELQRAKVEVEQARTQIERTKAAIERSREKTERYEFVNNLLPDLLKEDKEIVVLRSNLISLVLDEAEASRLFAGFASAEEASIKNVGDAGMKAVAGQTRYEQALALERDGFAALVDGDYERALRSFEDLVSVYPDFHSASEIATVLRDKEDAFATEAGRKEVYRIILRRYSWKAPQRYLDQLRDRL